MTVTVNGMTLASYLGEEEHVNPDLRDKKSKEVEEFIVFELRAMNRIRGHHTFTSQPIRTISQAAKGAN